ncbi:hypothetical protein N7532_003612 [Penicillium argentinense]|uniref:Mid2 domain-containing protein n=1 Tax=Penicillium argentinense TaxID=1131581 RepID=A0A9W9FMZ2_9EURO|nr:uncharacterized protein N7532_003612 [Penicillium argentinense]KAJ5103083.1 hypothetical protein N7532_003612 [Penicillium argentinense]
MLGHFLAILSCFLYLFGIIAALPPGEVALRTRNAPGKTDIDTINEFGRALHVARAQSNKSTHPMNKTSLAKSWSGATLFQYSDNSIAINCVTCYVNGSVTGDMTITGDFADTVNSFKNEVTNITDEAIDQLEEYAKDAWTSLSDGNTDIQAFPTLDLDFSLNNLTNVPGAKVHFEFDNLELYLDLEIQLAAGATYTLNLISSETPAGIKIPGLTVGAVFSIDLILIATAEVDIGSGIHIKLDDGLAFDMELFQSNVSGVTLPSGSYEFLPITIEGHGTIQAILKLQASVGVEFASGDLSILPSYSAGIGADVFAYVADFVVEVNGTSTADEGECELEALAEYTLAVGAAAGATVAIDDYSWGPAPDTTIPIWYTTLASTCAEMKSATPSAQIMPRSELGQRDDLITTSVTTEETYTIVRCISSGLANCPVNLQNTTSYESTVTATVTVESGVDPTFPEKTFASVMSAIPFGTNVKRIASTTGAPTSYTPSATSNGGASAIVNGKANGTNNKLIIGLCVGLGVPFIAILIFGFWCCIQKRGKKSLPQSSAQPSPSLSNDNMPVPVEVKVVPRKPVPQT